VKHTVVKRTVAKRRIAMILMSIGGLGAAVTGVSFAVAAGTSLQSIALANAEVAEGSPIGPAGVVSTDPGLNDPDAVDEAEWVAPTEADIPADATDDLRTQHLIALEQGKVARECMADKGFDYIYGAGLIQVDSNSVWRDLPKKEQLAWGLAMGGNPGVGADWHWEDAGCTGVALKATNQENAN